MKNLIVHIGMHKTGTTSFQVFMSKNREALKQKSVLYPINCCPAFVPWGHHSIPWAYTNCEDHLPWNAGARVRVDADVASKLKNEIAESKCENIVLSSEEFDILPFESIAKFCSDFSGFNIIPVLVIRDLAPLVDSMYHETVMRSVYDKPISEFLDNQRIRLNFVELASDWAVCSNNKTRVYLYDSPEFKTDMVSALVRNVLNLDAEDFIRTEKMNVSTPYYLTEIVKFLRFKQLPEEYIQKLVARYTPNQKYGLVKFTFLEPELRESLLKKYNGYTQVLAEKAFISLKEVESTEVDNEQFQWEVVNNLTLSLVQFLKWSS